MLFEFIIKFIKIKKFITLINIFLELLIIKNFNWWSLNLNNFN
jgi:hypothetical protein